MQDILLKMGGKKYVVTMVGAKENEKRGMKKGVFPRKKSKATNTEGKDYIRAWGNNGRHPG